jgi:hypothetical protein
MKFLLSMVDPSKVGAIQEAIRISRWALVCCVTLDHVQWHSPEVVAGIIGDEARMDLTYRTFEWCHSQTRWRPIPKFFVGQCDPMYANVQKFQNNQLAIQLRQYVDNLAAPTPSAFTSRTSFRHKCKVGTLLTMDATILDLGMGGAQIETKLPLPMGSRVRLKIANEELLDNIESEVLAVRQTSPYVALMNVRFCNITPALDRALQRHLLTLQVRKHNPLSLQ